MTDVAGNTSGSGSDSALVDITPPAGTITLDANVTADDVINATEASSTISITGSVTGDIQDGDTVSLTVNGTVYTGAVSGGSFSIDVAGSDLAADSDTTIDAFVTTTDAAGNSITVTDTEGYSVDTNSTAAPVVTISEDVNDDGFIDSNEQSGSVDVRIGLPLGAAIGDTISASDGVTTTSVSLTATHLFDGFVDLSFASPGEGGTISISSSLTDLAGNTSLSGADSAVVDTIAPASPTVDI